MTKSKRLQICSTGVLLLFVSVFSTYEALVYPYS
jgi:hypothetical protein